jgi:uncharacterized protein YutE (UPF0331/DUF86 family)
VVDPHLLEQKLAAVSARLDRIGARLPDTRDRFIEDQDAQESVAFNLFIAFQEALDIAAHVIAASGFEMPGTAREHFYILQRHQLLSTGTAEAMARCAGLRNLIAHAYGTLDLGRLYDELPAGRATLERFCAEMARGT